MLLEVSELYKFYHSDGEEVMALRGVSFALSPGEFAALMGPSGSGKSTLVSCIAGLDDPDGGHVKVRGLTITRAPEQERMGMRARDIGLMIQGNNLVSHLSVEDNVRAAVEPAPGDRRDLLASALLRLEAWGLAGRTRQLPSTLSGGERARVSLAVAMACSPPLLVLDEPTGEVDAVTETIMLDALERHCAEGGAILVSTHSAAVARRAYRSIKLSAGRIADA